MSGRVPAGPPAAADVAAGREEKGVGMSVPRPDGTLKVTGEFAFSSDLWMADMLWGATLRSPHPRARIRAVDLTGALRLPGVAAVLKPGRMPWRVSAARVNCGTSSRPPSTGVGCFSCTMPQSKAGIISPGRLPLPCTASHQKPRFDSICSTPKNISARHSPRRSMSAPPTSAPTIVSHSPSTLLTTPTSADA